MSQRNKSGVGGGWSHKDGYCLATAVQRRACGVVGRSNDICFAQRKPKAMPAEATRDRYIPNRGADPMDVKSRAANAWSTKTRKPDRYAQRKKWISDRLDASCGFPPYWHVSLSANISY